MVFSFFKKQSQKMPERQVARPKASQPAAFPAETPVVESPVEVPPPLEDLEFTTGNLPPAKVPEKKQPAVQVEELPKPLAIVDDLKFTIDEFDRDFTDSSVMAIDVEHDTDPLQSDLEQAVVLFANGQDMAARSLLESLIRVYPGDDGRRLWHLLFDLLQIAGDRAVFEKLGVEFAEIFETSPPAWRQEESRAARAEGGTLLFTLEGVLTAENIAPLVELEHILGQKRTVLVDCGQLICCDDDVAARFANLLSQARRAGSSITLDRQEAFLHRLGESLIVGEATHAQSWLLLLELLQYRGNQDVFEEYAVNYAVTFELSPPSWDDQPRNTVQSNQPTAARRDDAYYLSGDLKSCRFDELVDVIEKNQVPVLDFSGVRRLDFFSAGQLVNRLAPYKLAGREIVIRSPNHLVAELMAVVGLNKQARIIVPKS